MTIRRVTISDITAVNFDPDGKHPYFYLSEKYVWVRNRSPDSIYVSAGEPVPGGDGTGEIPGYACAMFIMPETNILYFSGNGTAEIRTGDTSASPFAGGSSGGGSGDEPLTPEQMDDIIDIISGGDASEPLTPEQMDDILDTISADGFHPLS